jgi:SAM-dependent methyltransferase
LNNLKQKYARFIADRNKSAKILSLLRPPVLKNSGYCHTCCQKVKFIARNTWLRDHYLCGNCGSIPRERALMFCIETYFPQWRDAIVHESSPSDRGASQRLARECDRYIPSQYFADRSAGDIIENVRNENLEALTFADESIDLHISQDVLEHVFNPAKVFGEIARTLKPGGAHIFTVPLTNKDRPSKVRAKLTDEGKISYINPPIYHHNPISNQGSLVTIDWGFDICRHIFEASNLFTHSIYIDDLSKGIRADYIEVLITVKPDRPNP